MRVGLIDVDNCENLKDCFPNLVLMKLSAWHKSKGDSVEWYEPMFSGHMDVVYMSKVFSFTPDYPYFIDADVVHRGGVDTAFHLTKMGKNITTNPKTKTFLTRSNTSCRIIAFTV